MPDYIFDMVLQRSRISRVYFRATKFLRLANLRAGFYIWANKLRRVSWSNLRGFKSKFLCLQRVLSHMMRRFMMTRNRSFMDIHRMMEMDAHADKVADIFFEFEPTRVFRHISTHMPKSFSTHCYIDGCNDIVQHKMAFRTHMSSHYCRVRLLPLLNI